MKTPQSEVHLPAEVGWRREDGGAGASPSGG